MPIVNVGKKEMNYWIGKGGLLRDRETLLFIHGAGGGQYTWIYQKAFFESEFNNIIIELPGHGASGGNGEEDIGRYAEHVLSFLRILDLSKVFLVGHSMGGAIVQKMALEFSDFIKGIILVGTGARLKVLPMILEGIRKDFEATVRSIVRFAYSRNTPSDMLERGVSDMLRCKPEVLYGDFLACDRFDIMNEVERIDLPTLILCGEEDELTPVKYSQFLQSKIKGSKLELFPKAGHMVMMESEKDFNFRVREFILSLREER